MSRNSIAALALLAAGCGRPGEGTFRVESAPEALVADGYSEARIVLRASRKLPPTFYTDLVEGAGRAVVLGAGAVGERVEIRVRAGVQPGPVAVKLRADGFRPVTVRYQQTGDYADTDLDGAPDVLRLDDPADRDGFQQWFGFIAESQYFAEKPVPEVTDCAALLRFAYREALRDHDWRWAKTVGIESTPLLAHMVKYHYPHTLLGAGLFRVKPGAFVPPDLGDGAFAQFADAETLMRRNAWLVSRDIARAKPGDLLFFAQLEQSMPFHAMIYLGPSQVDPDRAPRLVYHTGPVGKWPGEVRRPSVEELLRHPSPRWRPEVGNTNFLGVYRWNILRDTN